MIFGQEKEKLRKTNNINQENQSELQKKQETLVDFSALSNNINVPQLIAETEYIPVSPNSSGLTTNIANTLLPQDYNVNLDIILNISETLLNFLTLQLIVKTPPENQVIPFTEATNISFINNYCKLYGDSTLFYEGILPIPPQLVSTVINDIEYNLLVGSRTLTPQQIIDGKALSSHCKKIFGGLFQYIDAFDSIDYRIWGEIATITVYEESQEISPGIFIFKKFSCNPCTTENTLNTNWLHKIINLTETSITAVGDYVDEITNYPAIITQTNISKTYNYNDVFSAGATILGTLYDITNSIFYPFSIYSVSLSDSYFKYIQLTAYRLYWDTLTQGNFFDALAPSTEHVILSGMPITTAGHTLQYSSYTLQKNLATFPIPTITENLMFDTQDISGSNIGNKQLTYYKIADDKYRISYSTSFTVLSPASQLIGDDTKTQQEDVYSSNGTTYTLTSSNDRVIDHTLYQTPTIDAQYKLRLVVQNPNYWKEERKYGN